MGPRRGEKRFPLGRQARESGNEGTGGVTTDALSFPPGTPSIEGRTRIRNTEGMPATHGRAAGSQLYWVLVERARHDRGRMTNCFVRNRRRCDG